MKTTYVIHLAGKNKSDLMESASVSKGTIRVSTDHVWKSNAQMVSHGTQKEDSAELFVQVLMKYL